MKLLALAFALLLPVLSGCGNKSCESDLDCVIICTCQPSGREVTVGPYQCNAVSTCGSAYDADLDCVRPCEGLPPTLQIGDDDDAVDDDDSSDDDDSARR